MHRLFFLGFYLLVIIQSYAQESELKQRDLTDLLASKNKVKVEETEFRIGKLYKSYLPIIGYAPALGFVVGGGVGLAMLTGDGESTHLSSGMLNVTVTTKQQININARSNIFLPNDKWILQGDWRLLIFAQPTYGLGIYIDKPEPFSFNGLSVNTTASEQPMRFNYVRFYENAYREIGENLYAGLGLALDHHYSINDQNLQLDSPINHTSHYLYSTNYNIPRDKYTSFGATINMIYDSRDNAINPGEGQFSQITYRINPEWMGSTKANSSLYIEYRNYFNLKQYKYTRHLIGIWTWAQFMTAGVTPYLGLPSITWDMYNRSGRGYVQGRLRGQNFWYSEAEYRFPITSNGLLGGVAFINATSANNPARNQELGDEFAFGYGGGIRIKMSKQTNTNLGIDVGFSQNGSGAVYFNLTEAF